MEEKSRENIAKQQILKIKLQKMKFSFSDLT